MEMNYLPLVMLRVEDQKKNSRSYSSASAWAAGQNVWKIRMPTPQSAYWPE